MSSADDGRQPSERLRGWSLRTKWTAALLVVALAPLLVVTPWVLRSQRRGLLLSEEAHQASVMDHAGSLIEQQLSTVALAVEQIASLLGEHRITDPEARLALARSRVEVCDALDSVAVYDPRGAQIDTIRRGASAEVPSLERLPEEAIASDARGRWLPPAVSAERRLLLRFVQPIAGGGAGGARTGFVVGHLRPARIAEVLSELSKDHFNGRDDGLVLISRSLEVLASSLADGELRPGASLRGRELFAQLSMPEQRFDVLFVSSGVFDRPAGGEWVGSVRTIPALRVGIYARRPGETVFTSLSTTRRAVLGAMFGVALVSVLVGWWIASRTTRPIASLVALARAFAARRFSTRSEVRTGDELETLGATMESMADDLAASEREIARRAAVEQDLSRFLPAAVAAEIAEGKRKLELGGERRTVSVLFADVVSFTPFAERSNPERVVEFLNELFTVLTEVVFRHEGTVDKFIGDAIMAFFGAPNTLDDHAARALACAEDMHRFVEASAPEWREKYGLDVHIAIGINSGEVLVGNLGSESRMDYTAIGDAVNVAARLEALARPGQTLVTEETARAAQSAFEFHPLGEHPLRGKEQPVPILELVR